MPTRIEIDEVRYEMSGRANSMEIAREREPIDLPDEDDVIKA